MEGTAAGTAAAGVHGFPVALTSFVGREQAAREVADLLGKYRLVTVTGPGGVGKTRLAGEVARLVAARFADGAWLAELAPVRDAARVAAVVAVALGVREQPGMGAAEAVVQVLGRRQLLVVLDNCEHVIGAAARLCAGLLGACDDVRVLATSREPLRIAGEAAYRLAPLPVPGPGDDVAGADAVALFADRAGAADAGFALTDQNSADVARLVGRLDGMPLAIELAAARAEALGVPELLGRIDDRFALLAGGDRLAPGRQQSLAATVAWSYDLLDDRERRVFRQVSVFPAPFTLEAAEAVAGLDAAAVVVRLVGCSLLVPPQPRPDGRSRYGMLETLRAYGTGLLDRAGEQDKAAAALAGYALRVAEEAAAGLRTSTAEASAVRRLDAEDAMMRQVLTWAMDHDAAIAVRLAVALAPWWRLRGRLPGQYPILRQAADRAIPGSDTWCAVQFWLGYSAFFSATDLSVALGCFTAITDTAADRPASQALADALVGRSLVLANLGRQAEADETGRRSVAVARQIGYPAGEALALQTLSCTAFIRDDLDSAAQLTWQTQQVQGEIPGWTARICSFAYAAALAEAGDFAAARRACAAALARARDVGDLQNQVGLLLRMAVTELQAGRPQEAAVPMREAFQIAVRVGGGGFDLDFGLDWCGHLCATTGRYGEALTMWAAHAATLRQEGSVDMGMDARRRREPLHKARQALGPVQARAAEDRGAAMSRATAIEYALMLTSPASPPPTPGPGPGQLSPREQQLVTLVAQGRTDAQIAAQLYISIRTVRSHLDRIRDKTGCRRRADLTRLALSEGLV